MKNLWRMRENQEEKRRKCLLKKIKFYEYLISYAGPQNSLINKEDLKNKTSTILFPTIESLNDKQHQNTDEQWKFETHRVETDLIQQEKTISTLKEPKLHKLRMRQTFRPEKKGEVSQIEELTAKSMTPSIRINKSLTSRKNHENKTLLVSSLTPRQNVSLEKNVKFSSKKRTYIGTTFFFRHEKRPPQLQIPKRRKHSICPWEVQTSPL